MVSSSTTTSGHNRVFEWITARFLITTRGPMTVSCSRLQSSPITVSLSMILPLTVLFFPRITWLYTEEEKIFAPGRMLQCSPMLVYGPIRTSSPIVVPVPIEAGPMI